MAEFWNPTGFLARLDGFTPTEVPGSLILEQAVEAAVVLSTRRACGIHHSLFDNPPRCIQQERAVERFMAAMQRRGITTLTPGPTAK